MVIKELTVSGFKSFGRKTVFRFNDGVTAVVGPNGSGKSNIADALRWVLGEQSPRTLRVKKTEDLIFAGTGSKARGSMAEVSVLLDAEYLGEGEIQITRKLYGSGESDYRLNGRKVRLQQIQELLAKLRLGVGSYAIISQGTIDKLVLSTPSERKLLFEEASGIREYELRRSQTLKRLQDTEGNMQRAADILSELSPRLAALEKSLEASQRREELERELDLRRSDYAAAVAQEQFRERKAIEDELANLATQEKSLADAIERLAEEQQSISHQRREDETQRKNSEKSLLRHEADREQILNELLVKQAEQKHLLERLAEIEASLKASSSLSAELEAATGALKAVAKEIKASQLKQEACEQERAEIKENIKRIQQKLVRQRRSLKEASNHEYVAHAHAIMTDMQRALQTESIDYAQLRELAFRVRRLLQQATEEKYEDVLQRVKYLQADLADALRSREAVDDKYTKVTLELRRHELEETSQKEKVGALNQRMSQVKDMVNRVESIRSYIEKRAAEIAKLDLSLKDSQEKISQERQRLSQKPHDLSMEKIAKAAAELERQTEARKQLLERQSELKAQLKSMKAIPETSPKPDLIEASSAELQQQIIKLESRIEALQEFGPEAADEHGQAKERHEFISQQLQDLEEAKQNLQTIVAQLDEAIKDQYDEAFGALSERFGRMAERLFSGGTGRLVLQRTEEEVGIDIELTPPGKRVKHLGALSGGERSLAGIALLAAIVEGNPSPLLVLDEVDAALDESNTLHFQRLLRDIAASTQVVVITHNDVTMEAAASLYGVTMDSDNVSQTVSVELDRAMELAKTS